MPLLVLADIYSGSPCRSAITQLFSSSKKSYLIAGISLPLVMEAYLQRNGELSQIVDNLISVAKENVINVNELLLKTKQNRKTSKGEKEMEINFLQIILLSLYAFIAINDAIHMDFGLNRPLIAGCFAGVVMGNLSFGLTVGATLQLMVLGVSNFGGSHFRTSCLLL